jgi:hypothetical protein
VICDPGELAFRDGALWHGGLRIDLVYNRLTDFASTRRPMLCCAPPGWPTPRC